MHFRKSPRRSQLRIDKNGKDIFGNRINGTSSSREIQIVNLNHPVPHPVIPFVTLCHVCRAHAQLEPRMADGATAGVVLLVVLVLDLVGVRASGALKAEGLALRKAMGLAGLGRGLGGPVGLPRLSLGLLRHDCGGFGRLVAQFSNRVTRARCAARRGRWRSL